VSETRDTGGTTFRLLTETGAAREAVEPLLAEPLVGLDTETFWESAANRSKLSLVQVAAPQGDVLVIDALAVDVEIIRPLVESTSVRMAAHNARFDEMVLTGAGLRPAAFVDTLTMSRMSLRLPSHSLASVAEHLFGARLDKSFQKSNWRRRPLSPAQVAYAAEDARMTLRVYQELSRRLEVEGRLELALRVATLRPADPNREPRKRRATPAPAGPPLTKEEKRIVKALKGWRLSRANEQRVPAYMVCQDRTLEHLARERPSTLEALRNIHGLGESKITRFGEELLKALGEACGTGEAKK